MASLFQIRRGVDTGSLQNGELYYNQTSQSLQIGSDSDSIITLSKLNETNSGSFGISGDLFVSGNARIVGNLTFGDSDAIDTVTVVASFSSSLIPQSTNNFDLGDSTTYWKTGYISSITGSLSGSVDGINVTQLSASVSQSIGNLNNSAAVYDSRLDNLEQHSGSVNAFTASITASYNATSQSLNFVSQSLVNVSASYIATSHSFDIVSSSLLIFSSSQYNADSTSIDISLKALNQYSSSLKAAIEVSGSGVGSLTTIYGDLKVEGTQSIIHSENLAVKDNLIYLNDSSSITNPDLGIVGNYNDGTYAHTGIYRESVGGKWRVFKGLTDEPSGSINSGHPSFQLADFEANEISASINGIGRVGAYSASVNTRVTNLELTSSNIASRVVSIENYTASISTSVGLLESTASYLYTTFSTSVDSRLAGTEFTASYLYTTFSTSVDSRIDSLENFSASQYINDSSSFTTRISASTLTFNDTTGQIGIDFIQNGTQVSGIVSGLSTTSSVQFNNITASNSISASGTVYCDTLVATTLVGATLPVLEYETNGTLGNILIKGSTSKAIQVVDTITFQGLTQNGTDQYSAGALYMTGSISASLGFSGSVDGIGNVTLYSQSVAGRLNTIETRYATTGSNSFSGSQYINGDITASNLFVSGTIYAYELHTIIQSSSVIFTSGSNQIGDNQSDVLTITGSLYQTGSTSFSELSGSLFAFSASLNNRINNSNSDVNLLSASIYQTDATQSNNILTNSASAWGAFQSASSYSASLTTTINTLSSSIYQTDATQSANITLNSASAWGAFQSASSYSSSLAGTINTLSSSVASRLASEEFKSTTFATTGSNTFTSNQIISGSLNVTGDVIAYSTSDERLKDNIQLISNPIQKVNELRGVEFDWKDGMPKAGQHEYGVIAQDVLKVMPELVNQRQDGYYAVDYDKIVGLLIEVVKEQEKRIKELENKIG